MDDSNRNAAPKEPQGSPSDPVAELTALSRRYWDSVGHSWSKWMSDWRQWATEAFTHPHRMPIADRRFAGPEWDTPYFAMLRDQYLAMSKYCEDAAASIELPAHEKGRLQFAVRQWLDAIAPSNFPATNPQAIKLAIATGGESVRKGAENLAHDLARGRVAMTDESAFRVGANLALTPGSVVYRNELIELIQYAPATPKVAERPLIVIPPCINKFYILDLQPENSFVRYAVSEGQTVFLVSWRNVPPALGALTWDDYLEQGVMQAITVAKAVAGNDRCNVLGFCVGGTMLTCALAVLRAKGDDSVSSLTLLTTMLDFGDPGQIGVYIDDASLKAREATLMAGGRVNGYELASAFASLRANELVWSFVVNNYLKGKTPPAFDLLYWNGDSSNLPGPWYVYYIRNFYLYNLLRESGVLTMSATSIDLTHVDMPAYILATREDHIVPWRSAYKSLRLLGGDAQFVLGGSGHIAGVINPAVKNKRECWIDGLQGADPDQWLASAEEHKGSWWPHWRTWLSKHSGRRRAAPQQAGSGEYPPLDPAPGRYVLDPA